MMVLKFHKKTWSLRGPGEFLGVKQHGFNEFKFANFVENTQILETTQKLAAQNLRKRVPFIT
jgi:ATP-dependent DNA helicase RecG